MRKKIIAGSQLAGAALIVFGAAMFCIQAALIVAGALLLSAAVSAKP
jgi:hypothetical protein